VKPNTHAGTENYNGLMNKQVAYPIDIDQQISAECVTVGYPCSEKVNCNLLESDEFRKTIASAVGQKPIEQVTRDEHCAVYTSFTDIWDKISIPGSNLISCSCSLGSIYVPKAPKVIQALNFEPLINLTCISTQGFSGGPVSPSPASQRSFVGLVLGGAPEYTEEAACATELIMIRSLKNSYEKDFKQELNRLFDPVTTDRIAQNPAAFREGQRKMMPWQQKNHNVAVSTSCLYFVKLYEEYVYEYINMDDVPGDTVEAYKAYVNKYLKK